MSGPRLLVTKEVLFERFIAAFDDFMGSLAEHGQVNVALRNATLAGQGTKDLKEAAVKAQRRFDAARDTLVAAREALGPMRITTAVLPGDPEGTPKALWTPGR